MLITWLHLDRRVCPSLAMVLPPVPRQQNFMAGFATKSPALFLVQTHRGTVSHEVEIDLVT